MYCRNCGKSVDDRAVACMSCGVAPANGHRFCQSCGAETNPAAIMCVKCGVPLRAPSFLSSGNQAVFLGLNQTGLIIFIILLLVCLPLCWLPFVMGSCKGD